MGSHEINRRWFVGQVAALSAMAGANVAFGQDKSKRKGPPPRVAGLPLQAPAEGEGHPLDPGLALAEEGVARIRKDLIDYECTIAKRERINGKLGEYEYMHAKIRNRKVRDGKLVTPFAVYLKFLKPEKIKGREVLWVEGENAGKFWVREAGMLGRTMGVLSLDPKGTLAMTGQLYPITEIGLETLLVRLLEKGNRDRKHGECEVNIDDTKTVNDRACTVIEVVHPVPRKHFDFHRAEIFIDKELELPIRYASFTWPKNAGEEPPVIEEYTYLKLKTNMGYPKDYFSRANPEFNLK